jgi:3-(3-hydroxy-phenyl)propionate hydroxylase
MNDATAAADAAYDVLIVGYGPVGALLANLLGRDGIRTAVLERDREVYRLPRALHFDHEVMRIFQSVGLAEAILPHTSAPSDYEFRNADRELLFRFNLGQEITSQGWRPDYIFHQPSLEAELRAGVTRYGCVDIFLEHEVIAVEEGDDAVEIAVRYRRDSSERRVRAAYVIGCDGANSVVRKRAGLELEDLAFDEPWLVVDAEIAKSKAELGLPEPMLQLCDPARPTTFITGTGPHIRWEFMLMPGESGEDMLRTARVKELIAAWTDPNEVDIIRTAVYVFHALVARRWNTRRVFLAGDSAHQTPPFLGQGMCAGMRDVANLAWRLGLALRGAATEAVFASYQQERSPHVRQLIEIAVGMGRIICSQDPEAARVRDASFLGRPEKDLEAPEFPWLMRGCLFDGASGPSAALTGKLGMQARVRGSDGSEGLLDDVIGPGFALLVNGVSEPKLTEAAARVLDAVDGEIAWIHPADTEIEAAAIPHPRRLLDLDGAYARWFLTHECDAVLVRPDHCIYGAASGPTAPSQLLESLGQHLARAE